MKGNNGDDPENIIAVDPSDVIEALGYLLLREHNKAVFMYQGSRDLKFRAVIAPQIDHMKELLGKLHLNIKEIDQNKGGGG